MKGSSLLQFSGSSDVSELCSTESRMRTVRIGSSGDSVGSQYAAAAASEFKRLSRHLLQRVSAVARRMESGFLAPASDALMPQSTQCQSPGNRDPKLWRRVSETC